MRIFTFVIALLGLSCAPGYSQFLQPLIVVRESHKSNVALQMCAQALINRQEMLKGLVDQPMRVVALSEVEAVNARAKAENRQVLNFVEVAQPPAGETMAGIPFAFRDAAHFLAFMESELYQDAVDIKSGNVQKRLAFAYGGFFQIFSRSAALTEPKHFYKRWLGGTVQARETYSKFDALIAPLSGTLYYFGYLDKRDFAELPADRTINMVEAHLASSIENGALLGARYVNLVSSAILPVEFVFGLSDGFYAGNLNLVRTEKIRLWAETAARDCSEKVYQKELDVLKALKEAGVEVIPFNRQSLMEESWRQTLIYSHVYWTNEQFDQIVRLGEFPRNARSPMQLLSTLSPADRTKADVANRTAANRVAEDARDALLKNGNELYVAGEVERALAYYLRALKADPHYKEWGLESKLAGIGFVLEYKDDFTRALVAYRAAYRLNPTTEIKDAIANLESKTSRR